LRAMGRAHSIEDAGAQAAKLWASRDIRFLEKFEGVN